jgi:hypothetical protein
MRKNILICILLCFQYSICQTVYYDDESDKFGIIDKTGKIILKPTYEEMTLIENGYCRFKENEKWGLMNEKGIKILKPQFDDRFSICYFGYKDGLISAVKNNKYGFYDYKGNLVIQHKYDYAQQFCNGMAWVKVGEKYSFIDNQGNYVTDKWFDDVKIIDGISYGYINDLEKYYEINKKDGSVLAPNQEYISKTERHWLAYCDLPEKNPNKTNYVTYKENRLFGFKTLDNQIVKSATYKYAFNFNNGVALVQLTSNNYAIINMNFDIVKDLGNNYQPIWRTSITFENGLLMLHDTSVKNTSVATSSSYVLFNTDGKVIKTMKTIPFSAYPGGG